MLKADRVLPAGSASVLIRKGHYPGENKLNASLVQDYVSGLAADHFLYRESFKDGLKQPIYQTEALEL